MMAEIRQRREAIWFEMPAEVARLSRGEIPRHTGSYGQYFTSLLFAEGETRTMTDEVLWSLRQVSQAPDTDLHTIQRVMDELVSYKADFLDFIGLPETAALFKEFLATALSLTGKEELIELIGEMLTFGNRFQMWIDFVFPWGVANAFPRPVPTPKFPPARQVAPTPGRPIIEIWVEDEPLAEAELLIDKAPHLCGQIVDSLPMRALIQHAKLAGQEFFWTAPIVGPWENLVKTEALGQGDIGFYNPRQQVCLFYGRELALEPLGMSHIGRVVSGLERLEATGMRNWLHQGQRLELRARS